MKFHCTVVHGLAEEATFRVTLEAETRGAAEREAVRICKLAFPEDSIVDYGAYTAREPKPRRRDYEVQIMYVPAPGKHVKQYSWANCSSPEEAEAAAKRQFLLDHPGAEFVSAEARTR